jgi:hypothetical protein
MATKAAELYDEDFYAWTQAQATELRVRLEGGSPSPCSSTRGTLVRVDTSLLHPIRLLGSGIISRSKSSRNSPLSEPRLAAMVYLADRWVH